MKLRKLGRTREAAPARVVEEPAESGTHTLVVHLVGRICLVEHEGGHVALFLNAQHNPALKFPKHHALVRASIEDSTQEGADLAEISFADGAGRVQVLWRLEGYDVAFEGLASSGTPTVETRHLANIRAAYKAIDAAATWKGKADLLDQADPRPSGIVARLSLAGFDRIDTMFFDAGGELKSGEKASSIPQKRMFLPGQHSQDAHAVVRCTARFKEIAEDKPSLRLSPFGGGPARSIPFDDTSSFQLTFSNLCNCVGTDVNSAETVTLDGARDAEELVLEDKEFAVYYELLASPPSPESRPLPFVPKEGAGGGGVVECVPVARLSLSGGP